jgi:hypothetical protein
MFGDMREVIGMSKLSPVDEARIREIVREEIAAYWASVSTSTSYGFYPHDRDEPPASPPVRGINTTERL